MKTSPEILDQMIAINDGDDRPLHTQLRRSLRSLIERHFNDGERFFSESELIARLGLSQGTVRRALSDLAREGLIERRVAKGSFVRKSVLTSPQHRSMGFFVPAFESAFWSLLIEQFSRLCRQVECGISVYHTERGEKLGDAFRCLLQHPPTQERVVLMGGQETAARLLAALDDRGYRTVVLDTPMGPEHAFVGVDNQQGIRLALNHLMDLGHHRIALLINDHSNHPNVALRRHAYRAFMADRALPPLELDCGVKPWDNSYEVTYQAIGRLWAGVTPPTALLAVTDQGAWAAMRWCAEKGIRVPEELSIVGFDDDRPSRFTQPPLTSVAQPVEIIAAKAMNLLWDDVTPLKHELVAPNLVVRASTAPPAQGRAAAAE